MTASSAAPSTDPRAVKSRESLVAAMLRILDRAPVVPSISDLVKEAGASRPTFYQHYGDISSLIHAAAMRRLEGAFAQLDDVEPGTAWDTFGDRQLTTLLEQIDAHRGFYLGVLDGPSGFQLNTQFVEFLAQRLLLKSPLRTAIRACAAAAGIAEEEVARFLAGGAMALVHRGLVAGDPVPVLVGRLSALFAAISGSLGPRGPVAPHEPAAPREATAAREPAP